MKIKCAHCGAELLDLHPRDCFNKADEFYAIKQKHDETCPKQEKMPPDESGTCSPFAICPTGYDLRR